MKSIKAKVINGIIPPEEEVYIGDGTELLVIVEESSKSKIDKEAFKKLAGVWKDDPELGSKFIKYIYEKREAGYSREAPDETLS